MTRNIRFIFIMSYSPKTSRVLWLDLINFKNPKTEFIRHNENISYSIEDGAKMYLLRIDVEAEGLDFSSSQGGLSRELLI